MRQSRLVFLLMAGLTSTLLAQTAADEVRILALGDVNLGRSVGKKIFAGEITYPFQYVADSLRSADIVFANLESVLTDQGGETRHATDGYIFCSPPEGAKSLAFAGVDVVSTANNHAYDYGKRGLLETIDALRSASIAFTGTSEDPVDGAKAVLIERKGIRFGFLAYTEFVNQKGPWEGHIATFHPKRSVSQVRRLRKDVDVLIVSYHGGAEYAASTSKGSMRNMRSLARAGADVVLGHHPHVVQGVDTLGESLIFASLGNFVFHQPQRYWTQIGAVACLHSTRIGATVVTRGHMLAVKAGNQPTFELHEAGVDSLQERLESTSPVRLKREGRSFSF